MDLVYRKYKFMEQFMKIASIEKIEKLELFLKEEILEEEIPNDLKKVLDKGLQQINEGKTNSTEEVINSVRNKYNLV
ncbi:MULTISPECIES: hypothetical protein [unclassified Polaribacter]|uniref:hypothetical protein n=1 Tax=unclassified Polaribacter TaxID=196858 RepID=UPI0011BF010E|nr:MULTISPECIES: hypothetical protein [unclassified Polaribacter]TXD53416.1 hypothetical protein ES043_04240 [Polaribacter sp. IC063]TXD61482.1 hypothetical protein ES044_04590 [Polaribacter sp. IC066]